MAVLSFVLLIVALLLFLASTRQWPLMVRGGVWGAGVLALIAAFTMVAGDSDRGGLLRAFGDLAAHWYAPGESVLARSLEHNLPYVGRFVLPLLDLFLIIAAILGVISVVAFTPGDLLERVARPLAIGLVGAILGGVLALAIVGTGFGAVAQQRVYATYMTSENVDDGDTLRVGEVAVQLDGVDAPERSQICRRGRDTTPCGDTAARYLGDLVNGALVTCVVADEPEEREAESYRHPQVTCTAVKGEQQYDLGSRVIEEGYAVALGDPGRGYGRLARLALEDQAGLLGTCSLRPDVWRTDARAREAFRDRAVLPTNRALLMGLCPAARREPQRQRAPDAP